MKKRILLTGHTGFKGSWLTLMLKQLGHEVYGVSLPPEPLSLFNILDLKKHLDGNKYLDINNYKKLNSFVKKINPDVVIHLAAQPLVIESYKQPYETFSTNVLGTLNVIKSSYELDKIKLILVITSDKVYKNISQAAGYKENDALGGRDPYSASKSMADILANSWSKSFQKVPISIARAGNVIGGGDFSRHRLVPDLAKSIFLGEQIKIRNHEAVRPWQHVFDCLNGYLFLLDHSIDSGQSGAWNFGPDKDSIKSVNHVIEFYKKEYELINLHFKQENQFHEDQLLLLDSTKVQSELGWKNIYNFEETLDSTMQWYKNYYKSQEIKKFSINEVLNFLEKVAKHENRS